MNGNGRARARVLDAGIGARLIARGLDPLTDDPSLWCLDRPEEVVALHAADARAGARVLHANTFGAGRDWFAARHARRLGDLGALRAAALDLAREGARRAGLEGGAVEIRASLGPHAGPVEEAAEAFAALGASALSLETHDAAAALRAMTRLGSLVGGSGGLRVWVHLSAWPEDAGAARDLARRLEDLGAAGLGANCLPPPAGWAANVAGATDRPLAARPAAEPGESPEAFAARARALGGNGLAAELGACCGADHRHVAALLAGEAAAPAGGVAD